MLEDADCQQVIQKFSFIESLDLSRNKSRNTLPDLKQNHADNASNLQQPKNDGYSVSDSVPEAEASAIIAASETTSTIDVNWYQPDSDAYRLNVAEIINSTSDRYTERELSAKHSYWGKILFALACSYCLFVLWWLFGHQGTKVLTMLTGGKQVVLSRSDAQFLDYMERSLDKIELQMEAKASSESDDVVYVPVYTPAPAAPPIPQPQATPSPSSALKIPTPPPLPEPAPIAANPASEDEMAMAAKPAITRTLIGILELGGDKSAALIEVRGQTRHVWLGEEISNGWILESVGNQTANISYQGQVRSVSVGETF